MGSLRGGDSDNSGLIGAHLGEERTVPWDGPQDKQAQVEKENTDTQGRGGPSERPLRGRPSARGEEGRGNLTANALNPTRAPVRRAASSGTPARRPAKGALEGPELTRRSLTARGDPSHLTATGESRVGLVRANLTSVICANASVGRGGTAQVHLRAQHGYRGPGGPLPLRTH